MNIELLKVTQVGRTCDVRASEELYNVRDVSSEEYLKTHVSNNHLIFPSDEAARSMIGKIHQYDTVIIEGYLVESHCVSGDREVFRGTSTTRDDVGLKACENIYVSNLTINGVRYGF
jgi:hypothetical protein